MEWDKVNWDRVCPGCIQETTEEESKAAYCPHCGFARAQEDRSGALPVNTILNGKYILGKILERTEEEIAYLGYDLNLELKVRISEYFPPLFAEREEDGRRVTPKEGSEITFGEGIYGYRQRAKDLVREDSRTGTEEGVREMFEENGTAYKVCMMQPEEKTGERAQALSIPPEKQQKKGIWVLLIIIIVAVLAALVVCVPVLIGRGKGGKGGSAGTVGATKDNGATRTETVSGVSASYFGAYYEEENVLCLLSGEKIWFGYPDEGGMLQDVTPLAEVDGLAESFATIAFDEGYLYVTTVTHGNANGILRAPIQASEVEFTMVTNRNTRDGFVLDGKYIYYAADNVLYRAAKDGSSEIVLNKHASGQYLVCGDDIFFYSAEDGYIHRMKKDGSDEQVWLDGDEIGKMAAQDGYFYVVSGDTVYQVDIESGEPTNPDGLAKTICFSDLLLADGRIYYGSPDGQKVYGQDLHTGEVITVYDGGSYSLAAVMAGRLYVEDLYGELFSSGLDGSGTNTVGFNYYNAGGTGDAY